MERVVVIDNNGACFVSVNLSQLTNVFNDRSVRFYIISNPMFTGFIKSLAIPALRFIHDTHPQMLPDVNIVM